ncbi:MAG: transposase, partial [Stellaceae bacterium]
PQTHDGGDGRVVCDTFDQAPRRLVLDIDDTEGRVHAASNSRCGTRMEPALGLDPRDSRCFLLIHIYEAITGKPVAIILLPGKTPDGAEVALVLSHVIGHIRARWPQGADSRFIVTHLRGLPQALYEKVYCARCRDAGPVKPQTALWTL